MVRRGAATGVGGFHSPLSRGREDDRRGLRPRDRAGPEPLQGAAGRPGRTLEVMRFWLSAAATIFLLTALSHSDAAAAKKKAKTARRTVPVAPRVTAAIKASATQHVEEYLASSSAGFEQPGALVPVFEQMYRLGSGGS